MDVELASVDLAELRGFVERAFGPQAEHKGLELRIEAGPELPAEIVTDGRRLQQILRNLLSNAMKFTAHGSVALVMGPAPRGARGHGRPTVGPWSPSPCATPGSASPPDKLAMIFEAFQQADGTTSRKYGGTGLGLSISRELARLLGGAITVSSRARRGLGVHPVPARHPACRHGAAPRHAPRGRARAGRAPDADDRRRARAAGTGPARSRHCAAGPC